MANYSTRLYSASATFTPAAAEHVAGDVVGGAKEFVLLDRFGNPPATGSTLKIVQSSMIIAGGTIETTAWTLHGYNVTPPSAIADDTAWDIAAGDRTAYLGSIAIAQVVDHGATLYIEGTHAKYVILSGTSLFAYLVNGTTLTPAAVAHTVTLVCEAA